MRASVIVVSYNSCDYLEACLTSVVEQLTPSDELIVVDNGSTDGSVALIKHRFPAACLLEGSNTGYAGGNNYGASIARGTFLVFLNPDTTLAPAALENLLAPLASSEDIALTTACIVYQQASDTINTCGNIMHYTGLTYCRGAGKPRSTHMLPCEVDAVSGAAFAIRHSVFEELGGFDQQFFMYVEDTDLSLRAKLHGYHCWYAADAIVHHDYQANYTPSKGFYLDRNRHLMLLKNLKWSTYLRLLPGLVVAEIVTWGFLLAKGLRFWHVKPRVYYSLWHLRTSVRAARKYVKMQQIDSGALVGQLTYRLEFAQLANRTLSHIASILFHPIFWVARLPIRWKLR